MRQFIRFLFTKTLTATVVIAMEEQGFVGIDGLPSEVIRPLILGRLNAESLIAAGLVNKEWCAHTNDYMIWKRLVQGDFRPEHQREPKEGETWKEVYKEVYCKYKAEHERVKILIIGQQIIKEWEKKKNVITPGVLPNFGFMGDLMAQAPDQALESTLSLNGKEIFSVSKGCIDLIPKTINMINFGNNQIAFLPPNIAQFKQLQNLQLQKNQFTALPDWLENLTSLRFLNISDNPLKPHSVIQYLNAAPVSLIVLLSPYLLGEMTKIWPEILNLYIVVQGAVRECVIRKKRSCCANNFPMDS